MGDDSNSYPLSVLVYEELRYRQVLRECCLEADLTTFPGGDQALVAGSGATLSGGQRARISLARAVYSQAEIILLDDPLSAVDARVSQCLWNDCIRKLSQTVVVGMFTICYTVTFHFYPLALADIAKSNTSTRPPPPV